MRRIVFSLVVASAVFSGTAFAQESNDAHSSGFSSRSGLRWGASPAQEYLVSRARIESEHQSALLRSYDYAGIDYGRPYVGGGPYWVVQPPVRARRLFIYSNAMYGPFGIGY